MGAFELRKYQQESVDAVQKDWAKGVNRTAVVLPTGMGKTISFAHLVKDNPSGKSLILVHRDELAKQAAAKIHSVAPHLNIGVVKAERNETGADVIVGSVPTLRFLGRRSQVEDVSMIVADEAHHAIADSWMEVLDHFGAFDGTPTVGFSATLNRNDDKALADVWSNVCYERDILYGIMHKFLVPPRGKAITVGGLNLSAVAKTAGDFQQGGLGAALIASNAGEVIGKAYLEHCNGKRAVMFCPNVASAESMAQDLLDLGIPTEVVTGETLERDQIYARFEAGETMVLATCMVLTEGWDAPHAEVAIIARATTSKSLYIQMVGRVLRPWREGGKTEALVMDVVGVTAMHDLASLTDLTGGEVKVRDGESIIEAAERQKKEGSASKAVGILAAVDVDLFSASSSMWLQTRGGNWFIPTRERYYTIVPEPDGTFSTAWVPANMGWYAKGAKIYTGMDFDGAMAWAEENATLDDPSIANKSASWRRKSGRPSEKQINYARTMGIKEPETMSKGVLSNLISVIKATNTIDHRIVSTR